MGRTCVGDLVPDQRGAFAHQPPILFFPFDYARNLGLDSASSRPIACAPLECVSATVDGGVYLTHRIVEIPVPWFAIWLIPIHHPISVDVRGPINECAPARTSDGDALDLNRHVHTRIDGAPAFRYVSQHSPILSLSVCATIPSGPDGLPGRALRNAILQRLLPQFSITQHFRPLPFRLLSLRYKGGRLPRCMEGC